MNPKAALLLVVAAVIVAAAIIGLGYWLVARNAGVRRKEYTAMRTERNNAWTALNEIDDAVSQYSDIDSLLASTVRPIIRDHNIKKMEIYR